MARKQIRVNVDDDEWNQLKSAHDAKDDREMMDKLLAIYRSIAQLKSINPDPAVAVGIALANHQILGTAKWQQQIALSTHSSPTPLVQSASPPVIEFDEPVPAKTLEPLSLVDNASDY